MVIENPFGEVNSVSELIDKIASGKIPLHWAKYLHDVLVFRLVADEFRDFKIAANEEPRALQLVKLQGRIVSRLIQ